VPRLIPVDDPLIPEERRWQEHADEWHRTALPRTRAASATWLTALGSITGLLAIVTLFKGPEDIAGLPSGARIAIGVLTLLTLLLALSAMGLAAQAATGTPKKTKSTYADVRQRADEELKSANRHLRASRVLAAVSLVPLLVAVGLAWYVPRQTKKLIVTHTDGSVVCVPATPAITLSVVDVRSARTADSCPR
jgi:hypothetical protein